jgi:hypothetical protein
MEIKCRKMRREIPGMHVWNDSARKESPCVVAYDTERELLTNVIIAPVSLLEHGFNLGELHGMTAEVSRLAQPGRLDADVADVAALGVEAL